MVESGFLLRSCGVISSTEGSNPFLSAILWLFNWDATMTLVQDFKELFSTQGIQAFRMKAFYAFFFKWGCFTVGLVYLLLLLPIKFTADASLHAMDAMTNLERLHFVMWHDAVVFETKRAWQGKKRHTPRSVKEAFAYSVNAFKGKPLQGLIPLNSPYTVSSGESTGPLRCGQAVRCYKSIMSKRHFGVWALDVQRQRLIYDADGGVKPWQANVLTSLNVMSLFPLRDDKPFVFQIVEGHLLKPVETRWTNRLFEPHRLYGVFTLFEKPLPSLAKNEPLLLKASRL